MKISRKIEENLCIVKQSAKMNAEFLENCNDFAFFDCWQLQFDEKNCENALVEKFHAFFKAALICINKLSNDI